MGRGLLRVEKQAVEGTDLQVEACSKYEREKATEQGRGAVGW